jgi:hypothetical protein
LVLFWKRTSFTTSSVVGQALNAGGFALRSKRPCSGCLIFLEKGIIVDKWIPEYVKNMQFSGGGGRGSASPKFGQDELVCKGKLRYFPIFLKTKYFIDQLAIIFCEIGVFLNGTSQQHPWATPPSFGHSKLFYKAKIRFFAFTSGQ